MDAGENNTTFETNAANDPSVRELTKLNEDELSVAILDIGVDVGVLAVVPIGYKDTRDQREILGELRTSGFPVPVVIGERGSLMEGCWKQQCSPYTYVEEHRNRKRDYELKTLEQFDELARHLEQEAGLKTPEVTA